MDLATVFLTELMPLAAALYVLGFIVKKSEVKDKFIPLILLVLGVAGAIAIMPFTDKRTIAEAIIQGVIATGMAIGVNQGYKQARKEE